MTDLGFVHQTSPVASWIIQGFRRFIEDTERSCTWWPISWNHRCPSSFELLEVFPYIFFLQIFSLFLLLFVQLLVIVLNYWACQLPFKSKKDLDLVTFFMPTSWFFEPTRGDPTVVGTKLGSVDLLQATDRERETSHLPATTESYCQGLVGSGGKNISLNQKKP